MVMETLVAVAQHKNHYSDYNRVRSHHGHSGRFGQFRDFSCRTDYQYRQGLLPFPFENSTLTTPKRNLRNSTSFNTPSPSIKSAHSFDTLRSKTSAVSPPIPIPVKVIGKELAFDDDMSGVGKNRGFSELWAGPAYSNSPPPSSLPMPKFSMTPKRTVSLDLPAQESDFGVEVLATAKSAPASFTREHNTFVKDMFLSVDSATRTLRRILNLDVADE